eukprot:6192948-Pleurochrysis_carterae.AAC.4
MANGRSALRYYKYLISNQKAKSQPFCLLSVPACICRLGLSACGCFPNERTRRAEGAAAETNERTGTAAGAGTRGSIAIHG